MTPISQATPCGKQVFGVTGYRTSLFGSCITYFATMTGSVTVTT